jgi:hypothetical protein
MYLAVSIPEDLLGRLRAGAQKALLAPIMQPGEEWDRERSSRFARVAALLNVLGWQAGEAGEEMVIDLNEHALALHEALLCALHAALAEQRQAERQHEYTNNAGERVRSFAALIDAASRERAREDVRVRRLSDEAEALAAELEVEAVPAMTSIPFGLTGRRRGRLPRLRLADLPLLLAARRRARGGTAA